MMTNDERDKHILEIRADLKLLLSRASDHGHTLYGNGQPGLLSRVQSIEQRQQECPARQAYVEGRSVMSRQGWVSIAIAIVSTAIALAAIVM
jgi:hypothetical protein